VVERFGKVVGLAKLEQGVEGAREEEFEYSVTAQSTQRGRLPVRNWLRAMIFELEKRYMDRLLYI
jgi:hypothetical protein